MTVLLIHLDDMRKYLNVYDRPILGTIIKPKMGLTAAEYAEVCYDFWSGGGDFVKNDEPQANQDFCEYDVMVKFVKKRWIKLLKKQAIKKFIHLMFLLLILMTMIEKM
jgi:ribulose-bisphosphate carboxylase large chain